jgi:hypothetical protein
MCTGIIAFSTTAFKTFLADLVMDTAYNPVFTSIPYSPDTTHLPGIITYSITTPACFR